MHSEFNEAVFDLSQSLAGSADLHTLFEALTASLRGVVSVDGVGLTLYDPDRDQLRF